jgi:proteasome assembly chaperone 3
MGVKEDSFPAKSRSAVGTVTNVVTEVASTSFSDKYLVTISQGGRLSQWVQVPLLSSPAGAVEMHLPSSRSGLMPGSHLTPTTLLGGGGGDRETLGHLYATQIASFISTKNPEDRRILLLGLGLEAPQLDQEAFLDILELVRTVL